ncbi:class D sortase [uncultured Allofournierella sp.]|uniref:class D sortase n=1 Tax=uncultured Allofournierella sp. TaxID=1940258 RepID=UPI0037538F5D
MAVYHNPHKGNERTLRTAQTSGTRTRTSRAGQNDPTPQRKKVSPARKFMVFVGTPILFCALTMAVLTVAVEPTARPYLGLASYLFDAQLEDTQNTNLYEQLGQDLKNATVIPFSELVYPNKGDQYGHISIAGTSVDAPLYYGDSTKELNRGVATYADSSGAGIPGEGETVLLAAHNNTFFNGLQDVKVGDLVTIDTHYGTYTYRVTDMKVADHQDDTTYDFSRTDENLIMYTCYPFDALGFTPERYFVYAEYVSGPVIDKQS